MSRKVMIDLRSHPDYQPRSNAHWAHECRYCRAPIAWVSWRLPATGQILEMPVTPGTMEFHTFVCPEQRASHPKLVKEHPTYKDIRKLLSDENSRLRAEAGQQKEFYEAVVDGLKKDLLAAQAKPAVPLTRENCDLTQPNPELGARLEDAVARAILAITKALPKERKPKAKAAKPKPAKGKRVRRWKVAPKEVKDSAISRFVDGESQASISRSTGIPETTLSHWLSPVRRRLAGKS